MKGNFMSHLPAVTFFASKTKHSGVGREQLQSHAK
jgi:hypothetical protein